MKDEEMKNAFMFEPGGKRRKVAELAEKYGETREDIENKCTMEEWWEYLFAGGNDMLDQVVGGKEKDTERNNQHFDVTSKNINYHEKRQRDIIDIVDKEIDAWSDDDLKNYVKTQSALEQKAFDVLQVFPEYLILVKNKAKMEKTGKMLVNEFGSGAANGIDNLYHRRGMYEISQEINNGNIFSPAIGLSLGYSKEFIDILKKYSKGQPLKEILIDSFKDLGNNWDGLISGADGKNKSVPSRDYYQDFDFKLNRKK